MFYSKARHHISDIAGLSRQLDQQAGVNARNQYIIAKRSGGITGRRLFRGLAETSHLFPRDREIGVIFVNLLRLVQLRFGLRPLSAGGELQGP